MTSEIDG